MSQPVVIDFETQHVFREVGGDVAKLRISVAGLYDYATDTYHAIMEDEIKKIFPYLENASQIIGFNSVHFDLPVLNPYYVGNLLDLPSLDLMHAVEHHLGHRVSLDNLLKETLGTQKTGHGLQAVNFFHEGKIEELKDYCLADVRLTKELYEYGKKHREIYYRSTNGRGRIPVPWGDMVQKTKTNVNLTLGI